MSVMPDLLHPRAGLRTPQNAMTTTLWLAGAVGTSSCGFSQGSARVQPAACDGQGARADPARSRDCLRRRRWRSSRWCTTSRARPIPPSRFPELPPPRRVRARPSPTFPSRRLRPVKLRRFRLPRLAQILTPEESRRNTQELDQYTESVKRALTKVAGKNLTAEQKDIAERVQTYLTQAEQAREQDLVTAVNLARRADLLAKDLLERLP